MAKTKLGKFMLCVNNDEYPASLEARKIYRRLADPAAAKRGFVRIIDESGDDYLYPAEKFVTVELPRAATRAFAEMT